MEIDQLRAFVSLCETKNFSKTAQKLHVVQSSVSARVRNLEDSVGKPLFTRTKRQVEMTGAGRVLLPFAERILSLTKEAENTVCAVDRFDCQITVGSTDSMWRHLLRPSLLKFIRDNPSVAITTKTGHSADVLQMLQDGVIHLGFVYEKPQISGLTVYSFYDDEIILVASPKHPLSRTECVHRDQLSELPFVTVNWDGPIQQWIDKIIPKGYAPKVKFDQLSMLKFYLGSGDAIGFMPRRTVTDELKDKTLVQINVQGIPPYKRKGYMFFRKKQELGKGIETWLQVLKKNGFRLTEV